MPEKQLDQETDRDYKLSHRSILVLFVFYTFYIIVGLAFSVSAALHEYTFLHEYPILIKALIGSFGITLVGSAIFYSRKLYKHSIKSEISVPLSDVDKVKQTGIFMYFFLRPIFALCFSFLIILGFKVSIIIISVKDETLNPGFIYLSMFLSFFAGFSAGDLLSSLEEFGKRRMQSFFEGRE